MADEHDALLREVQEELRREQMQKLWERYNGLIIGVAVSIVLAVGGVKFWQSQNAAKSQAAGAEYAAALALSDSNKTSEATAAFEKIAANGPAGFAALARLQVAGAEAKAGKRAEAVANYEALANTSGADPLLKSFAQLQAASLRLGEADFTEMQNRLTPLMAEGSPYRASAQELLGLAALQAKKYDEARKQFEPLLIDPVASREVQERVKIALATIASLETGAPAPDTATKPAEGGAPAEKPGEKK